MLFKNVTEQLNDFYQFDVGHDQFYHVFKVFNNMSASSLAKTWKRF